jgi:hypothetical protein
MLIEKVPLLICFSLIICFKFQVSKSTWNLKLANLKLKKMFSEIEQDNLAEIVASNEKVVVQYASLVWKLSHYETKI